MEEVRSEENEKSKPMTISKKINGEKDHSNDENFRNFNRFGDLYSFG